MYTMVLAGVAAADAVDAAFFRALIEASFATFTRVEHGLRDSRADYTDRSSVIHRFLDALGRAS
jgi:hypothetical protein